MINPNANKFHGTVSMSSLDRAVRSLPEPDLPIRIFTDSVELVRMRVRASNLFRSAQIFKQDVWTDLYAMSRANYFIGSHSGVSLWAALAIEKSGQGSVFLPSSWVKDNSKGDFEPTGINSFNRYECDFE